MMLRSSTGLEILLIVLAVSKETLARNDVAFHGLLRGGGTSLMQRHLSSEQCSAGEELVRCEYGNRPCDGAGIANCDVYCRDACKGAKIDESDVECVQDRSCYQTIFRNSTVHCHGTSDHNCESAQFFASAVACERGGYNPSCEYSYFYPCSCREKTGGGGTGGPMCYDSITGKADDFCSSTFLGRTCKDWGNPVCDDIKVPSLSPIHEASECSIGEEIVLCDTTNKYSSRNCANYPIKDCSVYCATPESCKNAKIDESDVECIRDRSCYQTTFRNSTVHCHGTFDHNCESAQFVSSAVTCERGGYNPSCEYAQFRDCSCCEGPKCPSSVPKCFDTITGKADDFCASAFLGRTCKDWGNPVCAPPKLQEILAEIGDVANWVDESTSEGDMPIPEDIDSEDGGIPDDDAPVSPLSPATLEETVLMIHEGDFGKWMPWVGIKDDPDLLTFRGCGARIKFQPSQSGRDDTAANGLALRFCDSISGWQSQDSLTVYSGVFGTWLSWAMCPQGSYINGAQVRYEDNGGTFTDDTALNGLKILCTDQSGNQSPVWKVVHKGLWGGWKPTVVADEGYYLSGASVRYEEHQEQFWFDDTAMNGLKMKFATFLF